MDTNNVTFKDFDLLPEIQQALDTLGFVTPTEIQRKAIPELLAPAPIDVHGQAQTGTGKTLAFGIPLLHRIDRKNKQTQAMVVAPTRELAIQICDSIRPLAKAAGVTIDAIYGGASIEAQIKNLRRGVHIVVGTPGRINDHLRRRTLNPDAIGTLVLDEADIMLDMGFKDEINEILDYISKDREIWLFSATVKSGISDIMAKHMKNPVSVRVSKKQLTTTTTNHFYCVVPMRARLTALCRFIESAAGFYGFVFCQTKMLTSEIAEQLLLRGYRVGALHGDMSQGQRNAVINKFKAKEITILVATDVAGRGIDIAHVTHVINYSLSDDPESYVHRTGRTGRAGREGIAITFINKGELRHIQSMQRSFNLVINPIDVPNKQSIIDARMKEVAEYVASIVGRTAPEGDQALETIMSNLTEEQQKHAFKQMLFDKFLQSVYEEEELSTTPSLDAAHGDSGLPGGAIELFIPVGSDDDVTRDDVMAFLDNVPAEAVLKIRVIKRRTFMHVMPEHVAAVTEALQNQLIGNRRVRVMRAEPERSGGFHGGQRRREGGFHRGGRGGGGGYRGGGHHRGGGRRDRGDR